MSEGEILASRRGAIRVLTINRPARRNAMTVAVAEGLRGELEAAVADPGTGAVVLTGAGGHFSAGGDGADILAAAGSGTDGPERLMRVFHALVETVWNAPLPVVAAVSGVAYGGGFNLALACDLVVCSADTRFCQVFVRRGLIPDLGGAYLLPRLVGLQRAKQLMLLAPEIGATSALQLGLVNAVLPDSDAALEHALTLAAQLADRPRDAIAQAKALLNNSTNGSLEDSLGREAQLQAALLRSEPVQRSFSDFLAGHAGQPRGVPQ
jgi:2-(1,2-epoxy-1,2-dihydrophenyl)acetyl-CoA isomerase